MFYVISLIIYAIVVIKWIVTIRHQPKTIPVTSDQFTCSSYSIALLLCWFGIVINFLAFPKLPLWYDWSPCQLTSHTMMFTIYYLIIIVSEFFAADRDVLRAQVNYNKYTSLIIITYYLPQNELETKSMFIRYISHEIRNPLSSVQLGLDALEENLILNRDGESYVEILQDTKAALQLSLVTVNDMLTSDKIRSGFLILEKKKVSLLHWLIPVVKSLQLQVMLSFLTLTIIPSLLYSLYQASRNGIELTLHTPEDVEDVVVSIDDNKFRQVITNLVTNAFKFTPSGGKVVVSVSYVKCHQEVVIEVTDTGAGISSVSGL